MFDPRVVGIVGAGNMGAGIAQKVAQEGYAVRLADVDGARARAGKDRIAASLAQAVSRRVLTEEQAHSTLGRITAVEDLSELADVDLVIEVIFEDILAKKALFRTLDTICREGCVFATNTSSFYVAELSQTTTRPGLFVGLHYFFHPAKNRLLEIIPGHLTRPAVVDAMFRFAEGHGKTALLVKDSPGFAVNRFFVPWLNESVRMLEEGVADIPSIDAAAKVAFGIGMGPFELMNVTGISVARHAAGTLGTELGPFYEPADALVTQADSGDLWSLEGDADPTVADAVARRLQAVTFAVAGAILDEEVCSVEDLDRGALTGLRWARGPFEMMNEFGVPDAVQAIREMVDAGSDVELPDSLMERAEAEDPTWSFGRVDLAISAGIARITINRPTVLNALDEEIIVQLDARLDEALASPGIRAVVLAASGKAWVAGADISFFVRHIVAGDIDRIVAFTAAGHALLAKIEGAAVPVVARVHGMTLGGGVELALACHAVVASTKASFALPETGIGIYPGLGGTQRLPRIVGPELARRLILTGKALSAKAAKAAGLVAMVVPVQELDAAIDRLLEAGIPNKYDARATPDEDVIAAYTADAVSEMLEGRLPRGLPEPALALAEADLRAIGRKAPIALRTANRLLDEGSRGSLEEGLQLELDALAGMFGTADALTGLQSVLQRERPSWRNA
jgi:enoyl-CoA hydratase/3-hydroxyacyl-CoA dehydrogenase